MPDNEVYPQYEPHKESEECGDPNDFFPGHPDISDRLISHKLGGMSHTGPGRFELQCRCGVISTGYSSFEVIDNHAEHVARSSAR